MTIASRCALLVPWPEALVTLRNTVFRLFPAFPAKSRLLADSGGPSLPFGQNWPEWSKVARMATLRFLASREHPGYPWIHRIQGPKSPTPGRLNWPVTASSGFQAAILLKS